MRTSSEIKKEIDFLNEQLKLEMENNLFVLNARIQELKKQIVLLQGTCPHEFEDGLCKYCYQEE